MNIQNSFSCRKAAALCLGVTLFFCSSPSIRAEEDMPGIALKAEQRPATNVGAVVKKMGVKEKADRIAELEMEQEKINRLIGQMESSQDDYADGLEAPLEELNEQSRKLRDEINAIKGAAGGKAARPIVTETISIEKTELPPVPGKEKNSVRKKDSPWYFFMGGQQEGRRNDSWEKLREKAEKKVREYRKRMRKRAEKMEERYGPGDGLETVRKALQKRGVKDGRIYDSAEEWAVSLIQLWHEVGAQILYFPAEVELLYTWHALKNNPSLSEDYLPHLENWMTLWEQTEVKVEELFALAVVEKAEISYLEEKGIHAGKTTAVPVKAAQKGGSAKASAKNEREEIRLQRELYENDLKELPDLIRETAQSRPSFDIFETAPSPHSAAPRDENRARAQELKSALFAAGAADKQAIKAGKSAQDIARNVENLRKKSEKARQNAESSYRAYKEDYGTYGNPLELWQACQNDRRLAEKAEAVYREQTEKLAAVEKEVIRLRNEAKSAWEHYRMVCAERAAVAEKKEEWLKSRPLAQSSDGT